MIHHSHEEHESACLGVTSFQSGVWGINPYFVAFVSFVYD